MERLEPRSSQFGSAFAWLLDKGVSSARLGAVFGTTPGNIRVAALRSRRFVPAGEAGVAPMGRDPEPGLTHELGVRSAPDEVVRTPARASDLALLHNELDQIG